MKLEKVTNSAKSATKRWYDDACGTALALEFVGERWALLVMRELVYGPRRFGEIRGNLPGISANVLTQRLESLEDAGIVVRRRLPSPANVQVYELTRWGLEAAPLMRGLGRWAARSPRHDPFAFMSPASAMMSLETLVDADRAARTPLTVAFRFPADGFVVRTGGAELAIIREEAADVDVTFTGDTMAMRRTVYGKAPLTVDGAGGTLAFKGDRAAAERFIDLFSLPEKAGARIDTVERVIPASRAAVWDALTDPDRLARWVSPTGMTAAVDAFDLRPGGGYRMTLTYESPRHSGKSGGGRDEVAVRFVAIEPEARLDELVDFTSDDPAFAGTMKMTWLIEPAGADTRVIVHATDVPSGIEAEAHRRGMASSLENLAAFLA